MSDKKILIIATAAHEGGALNILLQFLNSIPTPEQSTYILFISPKIKHLNLERYCECFYIDTSSWIKRIKYDFSGFSSLVKKLCLELKGCINFQNVPASLNNVPQMVYLHQSLPFYKYKWNFFDKTEMKFFLISKFYMNFIKINLKHADSYIVQSKWLGNNFHKRTNFPLRDIYVVKPGVSEIFRAPINNSYDQASFLYPALPYTYKNHQVIVKALLKLGREFLIKKNVKVFFTCDEFSWITDDERSKLKDILVFTGGLSQENLFKLYERVGCILFPSRIESFGLPLIEAALMQRFIISADLDYAHEALGDYTKCTFADPDNSDVWCEELTNYLLKTNESRSLYAESDYNHFDQWSELQMLINNKFN